MWKGFEYKVKTKSEIGAIKQLICLNFEIFDYFRLNGKFTSLPQNHYDAVICSNDFILLLLEYWEFYSSAAFVGGLQQIHTFTEIIFFP